MIQDTILIYIILVPWNIHTIISNSIMTGLKKVRTVVILMFFMQVLKHIAGKSKLRCRGIGCCCDWSVGGVRVETGLGCL